MPDIITILIKRRKLILALTLTATVLALIISFLLPKKYLSTVTALPANSATTDKARIFNRNIETLYPEIGNPDELDRVEGTTKLDTIYLAVAEKIKLASHYSINNNSKESHYEAAMVLKKNTSIRRSAYGELKISVWDGNPSVAAQAANALLEKINDVHSNLQNVHKRQVIEKLKEGLAAGEKEMNSLNQVLTSYTSDGLKINAEALKDSSRLKPSLKEYSVRMDILTDQAKEYQQLISQYEMAIKTSPPALIAVENARTALSPDQPKILQLTFFAFGASLLFSILLAVFAETRRQKS